MVVVEMRNGNKIEMYQTTTSLLAQERRLCAVISTTTKCSNYLEYTDIVTYPILLALGYALSDPGDISYFLLVY